jgi:2-amino-4-hydroxy-6-hydroxymethyldihydropteridine diphosphokinase
MKKYFIALGSNLETQNLSRLEIINRAMGYLSQNNIILVKVSSFWESGSYPDRTQPDFINAVVEVHSELNPYQVLLELKNIEKKMGRKKKNRWGNRVLDLDIIGSGSIILPNKFEFNKWLKMPLHKQIKIQPDELILPHPRIQDRLFVLKPLDEVDPNWTHPVLNKTSLELINRKSWGEENFIKKIEN